MNAAAVIVLRTNAQTRSEVDRIVQAVKQRWPECGKVTVDLNDCDRVLRVELNNRFTEEVRLRVCQLGLTCEELLPV